MTPSVILLDAAAICLTLGVVAILGNMVLAGRYAGLPTWGVVALGAGVGLALAAVVVVTDE